MEKITIQPKYSYGANTPDGALSVEVELLSQVSDGYHTIQELYDHRIRLYIALCKAIQQHLYYGDARKVMGNGRLVWRSRRHSDGNDSYEGWFIMGIGREKGKQVSYHVPLPYWHETDFAETLERAPEWDGHTSADVLKRLKLL